MKIQENRELGSYPLSTNMDDVRANEAIVFIDSSVDDYSSLMAGVVPGIEVVLLDPMRDGVNQITERLRSCPNFASIHIVSHGSPGCLYLGNSQLSLDTLESYASDLQTWSSPSLLVYGCNVAAGDAGTEFIEKLHHLTGAEIAASANRTGSSAFGGDWNLEVATSPMKVSLAFQEKVRESYTSVLADTNLSGTILWTDSAGNQHPVRQGTVQVWDNDLFLAGGNGLLQTISTDVNGFYSTTFNNDDGSSQGNRDVVLRVFADSEFHFVERESGEDFVFSSEVLADIPDGDRSLNITIPNNTEIGHAFSLSDALYTAGTAATFLRGTPPKLEAEFPIGGDASFFTPDDGSISILSDDRWDWDVIHHEYAHYIAHLDGIDKSPGGDHSFGVSNIPTVGKLDGVRLGWSEGLATYLGTAIQQVANGLGALPSVPNVGDTAYTDTLDFSFTIDLETNAGSDNAGEGDEASVLRILWDIADDAQDTFSNGLKDVISLGHQGLYNILNNEIADLDRLDNVWDYFFNNSNDETRTQYGAIFEEYSVSPSPVSSNNLIGQTFNSGGAIPTFEWNAGNNNANDEFQIIVFNEDFSTRELVVNDLNNVTQWTPTQNQWNQILDTPGKYHFVIGGSDTNGFATGSYWSGAYNFFVGQAGPTPTPTPTPGNDTLMGTPGNDSIRALAGDDVVEGLGGNDVLRGNFGNDRLLGGADNDILHGGFGEDTLGGGDNNDFLHGNPGNDSLIGGRGIDTLDGDFGEDTLEGGDGNDLLRGGRDNDRLLGDAGDDFLYGNTGNDSLIGGDGIDTLHGNLGEDTLEGGDGNDLLKGGSNNDLLIGDAGDDRLLGQWGNDTLNGGDDNDFLRGGRNNDLLIGEAGDDRLAGQREDDTLLGGEGNDWLRGGQGNDSISGGSGRDTFVFAPNHGTDTIADFTVGEDFISLKEGLTVADVSVTTVAGDTQITLGSGTLAILPDQIVSASDIEFV